MIPDAYRDYSDEELEKCIFENDMYDPELEEERKDRFAAEALARSTASKQKPPQQFRQKQKFSQVQLPRRR